MSSWKDTEEVLSKNSLPSPVARVLQSALGKNGLDKKLARYRFVLHWDEIVGERIARLAQPECLRDGALIVRVNDSAWAQELSFQKRVILARLAKYVDPSDHITDVMFYVAGR